MVSGVSAKVKRANYAKMSRSTGRSSHYNQTAHSTVLFRRPTLSKEKDMTILAFVLIMFSVLSSLSVLYDIVVSLVVESLNGEWRTLP